MSSGSGADGLAERPLPPCEPVRKRKKPHGGKGRGHAVKLKRSGDRLTRTGVAARLKLDRGTLSGYLNMEGAPKPDAHGLFSVEEVRAWHEANATRTPNNSAMRELKETIMRMEAEERGIELGIKKGLYIAKSKILPAVSEFNRQLTEDLVNKFEMELPGKYPGKKTVEIAKMNADAIVWVLTRLKHGQRAVVPEAAG